MRVFLFIFLIVYSPLAFYGQTWSTAMDSTTHYKNIGEWVQAIRWSKQAFEKLPPDSAQTISFAHLKRTMGELYAKTGNPTEALVHFSAAFKLYNRLAGFESVPATEVGYFIGQMNYQLQKFSQSAYYYKLAQKNWKKHFTEQSKQYADVCNAMGVLYNDWRKFDLALLYHNEARSIREKLFSRVDASYAQSCNNLAAIYWSIGALQKAEPLALEAKTLRNTLPKVSRVSYAISCVNLANIYRDMGKFEAAEKLYHEAKEIRLKAFGETHESYIQTLEIIAGLYSYWKRPKDAIFLLQAAKDIREQKADTLGYYYAQNCINLSKLLLDKNEIQDAFVLVKKSLPVLRSIGNPVRSDIAIAENLLGLLYFFQKQPILALHNLNAARKYWKASVGRYHPFYNENTLAIARVYRYTGNIKLANTYYKQAFDSDQNQMKQLFAFTSETEKKLFLDNMSQNIDEYLSFYLRPATHTFNVEALQMLWASRNNIVANVNELRNFIYNSNDSSLLRSFKDWQNIKQQLAYLHFSSDASMKNYIQQKIDNADVLEKNIYNKAALLGFKNQSKVLTWKTIKTSLKPNEALMEYVNFRHHDGFGYTDSIAYGAFVTLSTASAPHFELLQMGTRIDSLFSLNDKNVLSNLNNRGVVKLTNNSKNSNKLYEAMWLPMSNILKRINTVYLTPSGRLHQLSFAGLPVDSTSYLSDHFKLVQTSNPQSIDKSAHQNLLQKQWILFGGINYDAIVPAYQSTQQSNTHHPIFNFLPGTASEIESIHQLSKISNASVLIQSGDAATEASFKMLSGTTSPTIIHVASHGFYIPLMKVDSNSRRGTFLENIFKGIEDPLLRCGLAFAGANYFASEMLNRNEDGILTAYEIANLQLTNTKLVVLSACETALGDIEGNEGVYGLQRAFKMAGAQNIIMSLWQVPDEETAEFMKELYAQLINGAGVETAFYATQTILKNKYRQYPEKWAAWVLYQ